jgi:hypothetical protein
MPHLHAEGLAGLPYALRPRVLDAFFSCGLTRRPHDRYLTAAFAERRPEQMTRPRIAAARTFLRHATARETVRRACGVASVVSPLLLLVNHLDLVLTGPLSLEVLRRLAMNFVVPYLVSSYSSARAALVSGRDR